jgi:2-aminoethylphosphonate-pyruvate transaminase
MKKEKLLFTPGPLSTSKATKLSMNYDYGSRDSDFIKLNQTIIRDLSMIIRNNKKLIAIPIQGSGTFAVEAMVSNFIGKKDRALIAINGSYGHRISKICRYNKIKHNEIIFKEDEITHSKKIDFELKKRKYTHLIIVHCETTIGILNPLEEISEICKKNNVKLLVDGMSTFGGIDIDYKKIKFEVLAASSNKCLEGVPGISFCITDYNSLRKTKGNSNTLSLDLLDQWQMIKNTGQWRFTPPTHVLLALYSSLKQLKKEKGVRGRNQRYNKNCEFLRNNMENIGFKCVIDKSIQAPIIVTFYTPKLLKNKFKQFYNHLSKKGFLIYPGKLSKKDTFRIGCIGNLNKENFKELIEAIKQTLKIMKIKII